VVALFWAAAAFSVVAVAGSLTFLVVRTIALWRGFRAFGGPIAEALDAVNASAEATSVKAEALGGASERMTRSLDRLARSRARLAVLTSAIAEVRAAVTGFVPSK
jgi:hypothetical protein